MFLTNNTFHNYKVKTDWKVWCLRYYFKWKLKREEKNRIKHIFFRYFKRSSSDFKHFYQWKEMLIVACNEKSLLWCVIKGIYIVSFNEKVTRILTNQSNLEEFKGLNELNFKWPSLLKTRNAQVSFTEKLQKRAYTGWGQGGSALPARPVSRDKMYLLGN